MSNERFVRTIKLIGREAFQRLQDARVTVVGLGAVGSYAVEGLCRAGVGHLRLVDFDVVQPSNINRQLYALESTLGQSKCELARQRVLDINPQCQVEALPLFAHVDTMDQILTGPPDLVLDAIDSLNPKVELICAAAGRQIPLISSMGAARRLDPSQVKVGPFHEVTVCHLAKMVRRRIKRRQGPADFLCVYSTELMAHLVDASEVSTGIARGGGRPRQILGSLPTLTGIFGLTMANAAIQLLLQPPVAMPPCVEPSL
jgi:tRNA A37 threonylcarbamoyladenosine dehydratase